VRESGPRARRASAAACAQLCLRAVGNHSIAWTRGILGAHWEDPCETCSRSWSSDVHLAVWALHGLLHILRCYGDSPTQFAGEGQELAQHANSGLIFTWNTSMGTRLALCLLQKSAGDQVHA